MGFGLARKRAMSRCAADTNAVVYFLNRVGGDGYRRRFEGWMREGLVVSVITRIEVLSWPGYVDRPDALADAEASLSSLREEPLTEAIVRATIALRQAFRLKVPDAIVAATAQILELPLVTRNPDDFKRVSGLLLIEPLGLLPSSN